MEGVRIVTIVRVDVMSDPSVPSPLSAPCFSLIDEHSTLNDGLGEGVSYRSIQVIMLTIIRNCCG